ncbi:hypothetical protein OEZ85_010170 [Tetradesmus obliquus]|uniref:Peroxisomal membrane protein PEX14 n=1 Tax=Tetradesmus obliquus TaxID=3088 RepID=A0ABY8TLH7_TETOB|nr:hypothetical protein OEZ85_010170 [Tetradesmus obliquus]
MSDADESSGTGLPGASSAPAAPQPAADQAVASFEAASLREDQIQNAVAFLSHPKVRGSPVSAKRSFLGKKGLTNAEIDEAFKRVPEAPAAAAAPAPATAAMPATTATATYGANNLVTYTQQQPAHAVPASQALVPQPTQPGALVPLQQQQLMAPPQQPVRWTQVVLGLGVAAASLYGLHQLLAPRVTAWAHQLTASRRAAQEAEAARTAALTAALQSLCEGQQQLLDSMQGLAAALQQQQQQRPGSSQAVRVVGSSGAYGGPGEAQSSISFHQQRVIYDEQLRCQSPGAAAAGSGGSQRQQQQQYSSNVRGFDPYADPSQGAAIRSGGGTSGPGYSSASNYSAAQQQQQQQQQQGAASSIGGAGAGPAGGFEVVPHGMQAGSDAMWGASSSSSQRARAGTAGAPQPQQQQQQQQGGRPDEAPHSAAFQEVMEMVRAGITPPNVRTDIDDSPPDPARPISAPQLAPRGKPWERSSVSSNTGSTPAAYGAASAAPSAVEDNFFQQQQQQQQPCYGGSNGFGAADGYSSYSTAGTASSYAAPAAAGPGSASSIVDSLEAAAASSRHKSMEKAGAAYDLSHLLGHDPGSSDAPWRPPPPPAATVVARPGSSGSSSSRTGAGPAVGGAGAAVPSAEQVVAGVAASAVANVVAASETEEGVEAALA